MYRPTPPNRDSGGPDINSLRRVTLLSLSSDRSDIAAKARHKTVAEICGYEKTVLKESSLVIGDIPKRVEYLINEF